MDVAKLGGQKDRFRDCKIGFIFQSYSLIKELNAVENVMLPALIAITPSLRLQSGEMQQVSIARALMRHENYSHLKR